MDMPCTLEKVLQVGKGSRGANPTGAHYSARPRTQSGFRYTFWPRNKTKTNLVSIKVWKRVSTRYIRGQKSPKASVGQKNPSPRGRIRALARGPLCANRSVDILTDGYLFHLFWTLDAWKYRFAGWTRWRCSRWSEFSLEGKQIHWRNVVDRSLTMEHF